jgi:hypothetical protein
MELKQRLGGILSDGGRKWLGPGPGHSLRDRSLSVRVTDDGCTLVYSFAGDDLELCFRHIGADDGPGKYFRGNVVRNATGRARAAEHNHILEFCSKVWESTRSLEGSPAQRYLAGRGFIAGPDLRHHPNAPNSYSGPGNGDALVALARSHGGAARALHVTRLTPDGKKAGPQPRRIFGAPIGCAVRLAPVGEDCVLAIGEGLETCLAYAALTGIPTWSALSAAGVSAFLPPASVRHVIIAADGDDAGIRAANQLADRLVDRLHVEIHAAPDGADWNDVLLGEAAT